MGYRSNILLELSGKVVIPNYIKLMLASWCDEFEASPEGDIICEMHGIKWYSSSDYVDKFEKWMNQLDTEEFKFIRIGEENDDIQELGCSCIFECNVSVSFNRLGVADGASIHDEDVDIKTMIETVFNALEPELNLNESKEAIVYRLKLIKLLTDYYLQNNIREYQKLTDAIENMNNEQLRSEIERCILV